MVGYANRFSFLQRLAISDDCQNTNGFRGFLKRASVLDPEIGHLASSSKVGAEKLRLGPKNEMEFQKSGTNTAVLKHRAERRAAVGGTRNCYNPCVHSRPISSEAVLTQPSSAPRKFSASSPLGGTSFRETAISQSNLWITLAPISALGEGEESGKETLLSYHCMHIAVHRSTLSSTVFPFLAPICIEHGLN